MKVLIKLKRKLHSSRGISMVMAMIAFLVVAMVTMVIVTGALTAARTVHNDQASNQNMLYLTSAAKILKAELCDTSVNYVECTENYTVLVDVEITQNYTNTWYYYKPDRTAQHWSAGTPNTVTSDPYNPVLDALNPGTYNAYGNVCRAAGLQAAFQSLVTNPSLTSASGEFQIVATLPSGESEVVVVSYVMKPETYYEDGTEVDNQPYKIVFTLSTEDGQECLFASVNASVSEGEIIQGSQKPPNGSSSTQYSEVTGTYYNYKYTKITSRTDTYYATKKSTITWNKNFRYYNIP